MKLSDLIAVASRYIDVRRVECEMLYDTLPKDDAAALAHLNNRGKGLQFFYEARRSLSAYVEMWGDREALESEMMWVAAEDRA